MGGASARYRACQSGRDRAPAGTPPPRRPTWAAQDVIAKLQRCLRQLRSCDYVAWIGETPVRQPGPLKLMLSQPKNMRREPVFVRGIFLRNAEVFVADKRRIESDYR